MKKVFNVGLVKNGEIKLPVAQYIFSYIPKDFSTINKIAIEWAERYCEINTNNYECAGTYKINLYLDNTTHIPLLASMISICAKNGIELSLFHYNTDTNKYDEQNIF